MPFQKFALGPRNLEATCDYKKEEGGTWKPTIRFSRISVKLKRSKNLNRTMENILLIALHFRKFQTFMGSRDNPIVINIIHYNF